MIDFRPTNPNRPPDWRWQFARYLAEAGTCSPFKTDRDCRLATRFAERILACADDDQLLDVTREYPHLFDAYCLYSDVRARLCRRIIEARLLARQTDEEIAKRAGTRMTPQTVAYYEKLFFSVRKQLDNPDYILANVFPESVHPGFDATDLGVVWKLFGFYAGPEVLDAVLHSFANLQRSNGTRASTGANLKDGMRSQLLVKAAIAVRAMPINGETQGEIMNLFLRMMDVERKQDGGNPVGQEGFETNIKAFLDSIQWSCGMTNTSKNAFVAQVDAGAQSLRASELFAVAGGKVPEGLETLLASAKFPEVKTPRAGSGQ